MPRSAQALALILLCGALSPILPVTAGEPPGELFANGVTARVRFQVDREHSCSQSFENRAQSGNATLEVKPGGDATLTLEVREVTVFGPSLGSYKQGQRDFHHASEKHRTVWRGKASSHGDQLSIRLQSVSSASTGLPEYGDAEYPPATTRTTDGHVSCTMTVLLAYPPTADPLVGAGDTEGQGTTVVPALRCRIDDLPDLLDAATSGEGGLPLGIVETLLLDSSDLFGERRVVVRQVKRGEEPEEGSGEKPAGGGE